MLICLLTCIHLYLISGNIPVDCAVFLGNAALPIINGLTMYTPPDFVPGSHQYLLSILSTWWCFGQLLGNLVGLCSYLYRFLELITNKIAWPLITNYSCTSTTDCNLSSNMGWRYLLFLSWWSESPLMEPPFLCILIFRKPTVPFWNWKRRRSCRCHMRTRSMQWTAVSTYCQRAGSTGKSSWIRVITWLRW